MAESFSGADQTSEPTGREDQGTSFSSDQSTGGEKQLTADQVSSLQQRDTHAQDHIKVLESENEKFRNELTSLADKIDRLGDVDSIMEKLQRAENTELDEASLIEKARAGVMDSLATDRAESRQTDNFNAVSESLVAQYGDKADDFVRDACSEHGMSWDDMVALARNNPKAALSLCKVKGNQGVQPSNPTSINTLGLGNTTAPVNTGVGTAYLDLSESDLAKQFMDRMSRA